MQAKYVIIDHHRPYLFPLSVKHSLAMPLGNITSAGFVDILPIAVPALQSIKLHFTVHGRSASLNLGPTPEDEFLLETYFSFLSQGGSKCRESTK